jgi:hypothetical protein
MRHRFFLLCLGFVLLALWLLLSTSRTEKPESAVAVPPQVNAAPPPAQVLARGKAKLLTFPSKGKVRLKAGESAVLGFWEMTPGKRFLAVVTPEILPKSHVKFSARILRLSDAALVSFEAGDLLPDMFDVKNYSAIGPEQLRNFCDGLQSTQGVDTVSSPIMMTVPGNQAQIAVGILGDSQHWLGLMPDLLANEGEMDLSIELMRRHKSESLF